VIKLEAQPFNCVHCGKAFMKEKTLFAHMCEPKRRAMQKDEKRVQSGFYAFNQWYKIREGSQRQKTYEEFCKSAYYNAFVKFGSFVNNVTPIHPERFIDYVIRSDVKLDHWCRDELYEKYIVEMLKTEPVESAIQRSIQHMMEWADNSGASFEHYFLYVNLNRAVNDLRNGYISPWILLSCKGGKELLAKFNDEQLELISVAFDLSHWVRKLRDQPGDAALVEEVCTEAGIQ
jgi:hypothetical protein